MTIKCKECAEEVIPIRKLKAWAFIMWLVICPPVAIILLLALYMTPPNSCPQCGKDVRKWSQVRTPIVKEGYRRESVRSIPPTRPGHGTDIEFSDSNPAKIYELSYMPISHGRLKDDEVIISCTCPAFEKWGKERACKHMKRNGLRHYINGQVEDVQSGETWDIIGLSGRREIDVAHCIKHSALRAGEKRAVAEAGIEPIEVFIPTSSTGAIFKVYPLRDVSAYLKVDNN